MDTPEIKKVPSIQVIDPDDDSNDHHHKNQTTRVRRRIRASVLEVEELIEVSPEAEKPNAR